MTDIRILLVDDEPDIRAVVDVSFVDAGWLGLLEWIRTGGIRR